MHTAGTVSVAVQRCHHRLAATVTAGASLVQGMAGVSLKSGNPLSTCTGGSCSLWRCCCGPGREFRCIFSFLEILSLSTRLLSFELWIFQALLLQRFACGLFRGSANLPSPSPVSLSLNKVTRSECPCVSLLVVAWECCLFTFRWPCCGLYDVVLRWPCHGPCDVVLRWPSHGPCDVVLS